jgi:hypothetical protein
MEINYFIKMILFNDLYSIADVLEVHADSIFRIDPEGGGSM